MYGSLEDEIICDKIDNTQAPASLTFTNCLLKTKKPDNVPSWVVRNNCKENIDPQFEDYTKLNFRSKSSNAPMVNAGDNSVSVSPKDLDYKTRMIGTIDIGCYEFQ